MDRQPTLHRASLVVGFLILAGSTWGPSAAEEKIIALDDERYSSFGPTSNEIDEALALAYPQWLGFRQTVMERPLTAGDVFKQASFGGSEYGVNPAVLLVVVGMDLNWEPPADGDLFGRAVQAGKTLRPFYVDYYTRLVLRSHYDLLQQRVGRRSVPQPRRGIPLHRC